jgi:hypothetical protein
MLFRELIDAAEYRRSVVPAKWPLIASLVCGGALILTSCGLATQQNHEYPATIAVFHYRGLPEGISAPLPIPANPPDQAEWTDGQIAIVAWGSSGCPSLPTAMTVTSVDSVVIAMMMVADAPAGQACPADLSPTTSLVLIPGTVDAALPVKLTIVDGADGATLTLQPSAESHVSSPK